MNIVKCRSMKKIKLFFLFILAVAFTACTDGDEGYNVVFLGDHLVSNWNLEESFPGMKAKNMGGKSVDGLKYLSEFKGMYQHAQVVLLLGNSDLLQLAIGESEQNISNYCDDLIRHAKALKSEHVYIYSFLPQNYSNETTTIRLNQFINRVNAILGPKVIASGFTYVDAHDDLYDGKTISPQYVLSNGESWNDICYHLLASKLMAVFK